MGAALHLAEVHQAPPGPKRKRKGGGGGDGYDRLVCRVYRDERMTPESRELILLLAWLAVRDPDRYDAGGELISWRKRASEILGEYGPGPRKQSRLADLLYADRPRYETDKRTVIWQQQVCSAPMIRRAGECGQPAVDNTLAVDSVTGWRTPVWFCSRHRDFGCAAREAFRASPDVEPIPNAGGLTVSYFMTEGQEQAWTRLYREAAEWKRDRQWEPPKRYGIRADDWGAPGTEPGPEPFRLHLAAVDGELIGDGAS